MIDIWQYQYVLIFLYLFEIVKCYYKVNLNKNNTIECGVLDDLGIQNSINLFWKALLQILLLW